MLLGRTDPDHGLQTCSHLEPIRQQLFELRYAEEVSGTCRQTTEDGGLPPSHWSQDIAQSHAARRRRRVGACYQHFIIITSLSVACVVTVWNKAACKVDSCNWCTRPPIHNTQTPVFKSEKINSRFFQTC